MKEVKVLEKEPQEQHSRAEVEKKRVFKGSIKRHPGHILWRYNMDTMKLDKAVIKTEVVVTASGTKTKNSVETKEYDQFFYALNKKNAVRKLNKIGLKILEDE